MRNLFFAPAAYFARRKIKRQAADMQLQKWKIDWPSVSSCGSQLKMQTGRTGCKRAAELIGGPN
jgi:hypothetical protein